MRSRLVTGVDIVACLSLTAAIVVALTGGARFDVGAWRVSVRDPVRVAIVAVVFVGARWYFWPRAGPVPSVIAWWRRPSVSPAYAADGSTWLRLAGVAAAVVAQPLLDAVSRSPEFLVAHEATPGDVLALVLGLIVGVPTLLSLPVWLLRAVGGPSLLAEGALTGVLVALFAMQVVRHVGGIDAWRGVPLALVAGGVVCHLYRRRAGVRSFAAASAIGVVAVPALFVMTPTIRRVVRPPAAANERIRVADAAVRQGTAVPVVLLVFDEIPVASLFGAGVAGVVDARRYPAFAGLARDGILFRNTTTVSDYTQWAVPAILSGRYPRPGAETDSAASLYTLLGGTYQFTVSDTATDLCPPDLCPPATPERSTRLILLVSDLSYIYLHAVATPDLARRLPSLTDDWRNFGGLGAWRRRSAEQQERRRPGTINQLVAEAYLDRIAVERERPGLYVLHTLLPHFPHLHVPDGRFNATRTDVPAFVSAEDWADDPVAVAQLEQRHQRQLQVIDAYLGRLLDRLRAAGVYDRALVIVTSDHGISFAPGTPRRRFTGATAGEIMRVPLLLKLPEGHAVPPVTVVDGQRVSDRRAQTIDILPTIADVLRVRLAWPVDGVSLLDVDRPESAVRRIYFENATQWRDFEGSGPDLAAVRDRKRRLFDGPENGHFAPRPDRFGELVGRRVADLRVEASADVVSISALGAFLMFDPDADDAAFEVAGRFAPTAVVPPPVRYVAVAVNGVVAAVTRTWASEPLGWQVTPPPADWRRGANAIEVFTIDADADGVRLWRCQVRAGELGAARREPMARAVSNYRTLEPRRSPP